MHKIIARHRGEAAFRLEGDTHASIAFVITSGGNLYLQTSFGSYKKRI